MKPDRPLRKLELKELYLSPYHNQLTAMGALGPNARSFLLGDCTVLLAQEQGLWHLSIGGPERLPNWGEIVEARYRLMPASITVAMLLPPPEEYVNLNVHVFHLWEIPRDALPTPK